jgi:hypothetical protein
MDAKTTTAVANLQAAVKDYPRGTRKRVPHAKGTHEQWGALVPVLAGDAAAALDAVPVEQRAKGMEEMRPVLAKLAADMVVTLEADAVFELLDLIPKG